MWLIELAFSLVVLDFWGLSFEAYLCESAFPVT